MSRPRTGAVLAAALLVLAGCGTDEPAPDTAAPVATHVDVDTPALRAQKAAAGIADCPKPAGDDPVDGGMPELTLSCLGGGPDVTLSDLRGPLVVNLFAQWCGPCRSEMPYYQQLHEKARGKVRVLGIDYLDTQPDRALDLVKQTGVTYPLLADPDGQVRADFKVRGLPGVVLVDEHGAVRSVEFRVVRSYDELRTLVRDGLHVDVPR